VCIYDDGGEDVCHDDDESHIHCFCLKTSQHAIAMSSIWLLMLLGYDAGESIKNRKVMMERIQCKSRRLSALIKCWIIFNWLLNSIFYWWRLWCWWQRRKDLDKFYIVICNSSIGCDAFSFIPHTFEVRLMRRNYWGYFLLTNKKGNKSIKKSKGRIHGILANRTTPR
jgi:hypothetical protein